MVRLPLTMNLFYQSQTIATSKITKTFFIEIGLKAKKKKK